MATQNGDTGSTHAVSKAIDAGINYSETYDYIIGIFDHDNAGLTAYNTLKRDYDEIEEIDFPIELLNDCNEGDTFIYENGVYKKNRKV